MSSDADRQPAKIHFYASLLDDHRDFAPERHVFWDERVSWVEPADTLPKREG